MGRKRTFDKCYISNAGSDSSWSPALISSRVNANGGHYTGTTITSKTTHVVASPKAWKGQTGAVKQALEQNWNTDRDIKIVSFDWLDDTWRNGKKNNATFPYEWTKLDPKSNTISKGEDQPRRTQKKASGKASKENNDPKSHVGIVAEAFYESTDQFVDEKTKKDMERKIEQQRRVQKTMEEEERAAKKAEEAKKAAASFQKGVKKARNDTFSETHHIYTDDTGFKYDVLITKVDTKHNRNERWALTLQIYESNAQPPTYSMNAQFASTITRPDNNILAAIGCPFETAFRVFKKTFKDKTNVNWDDRISFHLERTRQEKRNRGRGTGSDEGTQRGVPVNEVGAPMNGLHDIEDFTTAYFQYHPPAYGPRGNLSEQEKQRISELSRPTDDSHSKNSAVQHQKVDAWMSGGNCNVEETQQDQNDDHSFISGGGPVQEPQNAEVDVDAVFGSLDDGYGDNMNNNGDFDFDSMFNYPFNNDHSLPTGEVVQQDGLHQQSTIDFGTDEKDPAIQISDDTHGAILNSWQPGTQVVGETQLAEKARDEYLEEVNKPQPDLGFSMLGKRKTPLDDDALAKAKVPKLAEADDRLAVEDASKDTAESFLHGNNQLQDDLVEVEMEPVGDDPSAQLLTETGNALESAIELD